MDTRKPLALHCPRCGSSAVYESKRGAAALPWLARLFLVAARCHGCMKQFYRLTPVLTLQSDRWGS